MFNHGSCNDYSTSFPQKTRPTRPSHAKPTRLREFSQRGAVSMSPDSWRHGED